MNLSQNIKIPLDLQNESKGNFFKKYKVIYADPPWHFKVRSKKGEGRSAIKHYNVMTIEGIKNLPINELADDNSVLFMWIISSMLPEALEVIKVWGFTYKTVGFVWHKFTKNNKEHLGMGYYTRQNAEICLIATKGKGVKRKSGGVRQMINSVVREHSRKPDCVNSRIEQLYDGPYVELFCRTTREGWDVWGNQIGKF
jgi:N6-adenosine-specific RNA methylase IME4